jgi:hypothetical protein
MLGIADIPEIDMKLRTSILTITAAALMSPLVVPADTAAPAPVAAAAKAAEASKPAETTAATTSDKQARTKKPVCDSSTASRIQASPGQPCKLSASPTRTYTQEELLNTGENNVADALRKLDPSVR